MFLHFCIEKSNNVGGKLKGGTNKKGFNDYIIDYLSLQQKEDHPWFLPPFSYIRKLFDLVIQEQGFTPYRQYSCHV